DDHGAHDAHHPALPHLLPSFWSCGFTARSPAGRGGAGMSRGHHTRPAPHVPASPRRRRAMAPRRNIDSVKPMMSDDTADIVGSSSGWMLSHMRVGRVLAPVPEMNIAITTSSNEMANENTAAVTTPGRIRGNVTRKNVLIGPAPRLSEAYSSRRSKPRRAADTTMTA